MKKKIVDWKKAVSSPNLSTATFFICYYRKT